MIKAEFISENNMICGFCIKGHSGAGQRGNDIVCAAVSSCCYMAANTITDVIKAKCSQLFVGDAIMRLFVEDDYLQGCQDILIGLEIHLKGVSEQYPDKITVERRKYNA